MPIRFQPLATTKDLRSHLTRLIDNSPRAYSVVETLRLTRRLMEAIRRYQRSLVEQGRQQGVPDAAMAAALGKRRQNMARDFPKRPAVAWEPVDPSAVQPTNNPGGAT
jgi:hypothetical protein